jgi:elongation factor 2
MPRFKQVKEIQSLMGEKEKVRNIGIIAHIDHGKTTLADALLAGAGLLSPKMAGTARVLDYLEEEQKRKITIKTANISLLYRTPENSFVLNLVDTPGHVDFTGKVTRALRAIDGTVVVVDAVEEIMAQTEVVTRQALEERVRPVLFINKVDRLITELQLSAAQIERKLNQITSGFNDLIELYGEARFRSRWKVDATRDSVAFGSALHGWGFTLSSARREGVKFVDIIESYRNGEQMVLQKRLPVHGAVFDMVVKNLPNPKEAQAYRLERIWDGHIGSEVGRAMTDCSEEGPTTVCVTNVQMDPDGSVVVTGRLFSGIVKGGKKLYMVNAQTETLVRDVSIGMGSFRETVDQVSAGNIAILTISKLPKDSETLVDPAHNATMVPFESITYISEPVMTVAIEPKNPKDLAALHEALDKLATEDPNLTVTVSKETGEYLLNGMGELHLEITLNQLRNSGRFDFTVSAPRVVYRESVTKRGTVATASSPNQRNKFTVQVEPIDEESVRTTKQRNTKEAENILSVDENRNVMLDQTGKTEQTEEALEFVIAGFEFACRAGPLCGEPLRHVKVNLKNIQLCDDAALRTPVEVMHGVGKAIFGSFLTAYPILSEPVYKTIITVPTELAGECSRIVSSRRGKISAFQQNGLSTLITGTIPVAESFGLSKELRSATSGRAFWQCLFDRWEKLPEKLESETIREVRKRKGLPLEVPKPERFMEEEK